jgi:hypothetical protein
MRLVAASFALLAALCSASLAKADTIDTFTLVGQGKTISFTLPASTTKATTILGDPTFVTTVTVNGVSHPGTIAFNPNGGFVLNSLLNKILLDSFSGPDLFSGTIKNPTFLSGNFSLTTKDHAAGALPQGSYSLAITPTPEPSSILLMATGLLSVAGIARRKLMA